MEFAEAVSIGLGHESAKCPFCPPETQQDDGKVAKIGQDNDSSTLAQNLDGAGDSKKEHLYFDVDFEIYRTYSAEAHHLICGNEVLKEEGEVEKYLIKDSKTTSKGAAGLLKPNDVAYDVNCAENGIWLPSVPDMFRPARKGAEPARWWGDQTSWNRKNPSKPPRTSLDEWERVDAAFIVMTAVKRQFHKGPHGSVGTPHNNYVKMAIGRLQQVTVFVKHYADKCPMENGQPKKNPPYYPPHRLRGVLNLLSENLHKELTGPPEDWNYYISAYALECSEWWKSNVNP
jgi:hypothetical protein